ncbi:L,D-transpeptidase [Devosia sp.]|uniref:L,D-transpeptidase n=1 Tax=Devosia sp. TaxID=1871048 RepID=UPI003A8E25AE
MSSMVEVAQAGSRLNFFERLQQSFGERDSRPVARQSSRQAKLDRRFQRQVVPYRTNQPVGTIVVSTGDKFLYLVLGKGKAMRYGIGTARSGFEWSGTHKLTAKRKWPGWTPPAAMRKRQPGLPAHMPGGINNPLGARALYIGSTLYRIHGTNEPWSIGHNVSSGCIRMVNADVEDLYERVKIGARVVVL